MRLKVDIDTRRVVAALKKAPDTFRKNVRVEMKEQMEAVARRARRDAKFKYEGISPSGNLLRALDVVVDDWHTGEVVLDHTKSNAPYARRIHEGGGGKTDSLGRPMTNKPNRFLAKAFKRQRRRIRRALSVTMGRTFKQLGLR